MKAIIVLFFSLFLMGPCNKNSNKEKSPLKSETRMSFDKKKSLASHFPDFGPNPNFRSDQNPNPCAFYFKNITCEGVTIRREIASPCEYIAHSITGEIDFANYQFFEAPPGNGPGVTGRHQIDTANDCISVEAGLPLFLSATYLIEVDCNLLPDILQKSAPVPQFFNPSNSPISDLDITFKLFEETSEMDSYDLNVTNYIYTNLNDANPTSHLLQPTMSNGNTFEVTNTSYSVSCENDEFICHSIIKIDIEFTPIKQRPLEPSNYKSYRIACQLENSNDLIHSAHSTHTDPVSVNCQSGANSLSEFYQDNNPSNCTHLAEHTEILIIPICDIVSKSNGSEPVNNEGGFK